MAAAPKTAIIRERCRVAPQASADLVAEQYLPLTFFDMGWLHFHTIQRLLFYQFPISSTYFVETVVPNLKGSLSTTLKHFLPLAGNLIYPLNSGIPVLRYVSGDSVSVTIAESDGASDFNYLTGNDKRDADEFHAFVPDLPEPINDSELGFRIIPLFTVQITLFPDSGVCIGFCNHHVVGDASSIVGFIKAWSSVSKLGGDDGFLNANHLLPFYDRSVIKDPSGLANIHWNQMKLYKIESLPIIFPTNKVRTTYILLKNDIQKLKNLVLGKNPALLHLSSFTVTTAYVWTCLVKAAAETGEKVDDNEPEFFAFSVDARPRLNSPVPTNYFGNCVAFVRVESTHEQLKGKDGFFIAADLIGDVIRRKANNKEEILKDAEYWLKEFGALIGKRIFGVAGSPKFDLYDTDFGWGNPKKHESVSIDMDADSMSLCKSKEFEGGLEIGLSLPKTKIDAFATIFSNGLELF